MDKADWPTFLSLIRDADEAVGARDVRADRPIALIFAALQEYPIDDIRSAVIGYLRTSNRKVITAADIVLALDGDPKIRSVVAWRTFLAAIRHHGYYKSVCFPEPAYHYVILQVGGDEHRSWEIVSQKYSELNEKELSFVEKDWRELYELGLNIASWCSELGKVRVPRYLAGRYENDGYLNIVQFRHLCEHIVDVASGKDLDRQALPLSSAIHKMGGSADNG